MIFDGKKFAARKEKILAQKVLTLKKRGKIPRLVSILVGESPESELYLKFKKEAAKRMGIEMEIKRFPRAQAGALIRAITELNNDPKVWGIMIQLPLPEYLRAPTSELKILSSISTEKDVDCLTPENFGLLAMGKPRFLPATVRAVWEIISSLKLKIEGLETVIVGGSNIVGKPLALYLSNLGATVTLCRSKTRNLGQYTKRADLLISAVGKPGLIKKEMVKKGAVVINIGAKREGNMVLGDVEEEAAQKAKFFTPAKGGVGPVTVLSLFMNLLRVGF